ncbi:beta-1,3-galactosyltransferase 5-like [Liolophura sinensis]|uniref:beta-1,3-galactosyltransferase 5-like n=1 Tax=Liolophura sinensis TaxID=3198878 RepID=UPI00315875C9
MVSSFIRRVFQFSYTNTRRPKRKVLAVTALLLTGLWLLWNMLPQNCERVVPDLLPVSQSVVNISKFIIPAKEICSKTNPFLLIFVASAVNHVEERSAIRATWGSISRTQVWADGTPLTDIVKVIFVFGVNHDSGSQDVVTQESQKYGDVVQAEFRDTYRNLTIKTTAAIKWVSTYCSSAKFVLKADDDVFLHIPNWVAALKTIHDDRFFLGYRMCENKVYRSGSNGISESVYPYDVFPVHNSGPFYAFPARMAGELLVLAEHMPYFVIEDAFFTGVLRQILKAKIPDKGELFCFSLTWCNFALGDKAGAMGVTHSNMYELWGHFQGKKSRFDEIFLNLKLSLEHFFFNKM